MLGLVQPRPGGLPLPTRSTRPTDTGRSVEQQSTRRDGHLPGHAIAAALGELGYDPLRRRQHPSVHEGRPGRRQARGRDRILAVDGTRITDLEQVAEADPAAAVGDRSRSTYAAARKTRDASSSRPKLARTTRSERRRSGSRSGPATTSRSRSTLQHRREHRRAQRRADVLAGDLRHAHPGLADRRQGHRRHRRDRRARATSARSAASSRRSSPPQDAGAKLFLVPAEQLRRGARAATTTRTRCGW